jgi:uncharacterized protein
MAKSGVRFRRLFLFTTFLFALGGFLLYLMLAPCFQSELVDSLATHPEKLPGDKPLSFTIGGETFKSSFFEAYKKETHSKVKLSGVYVPAPGAKNLVLISHGNGGTLANILTNYRAEVLHAKGYAFFVYDYAGYGQSEGKASYPGLLEDGLAAYDHCVKDLKFAPDQIILYGLSMGGGVTGEIAARRPARAVMFDCTFVSPENLGKKMAPILKMYPAFLFPQPFYDNLAFVEGKHPPLLILHGRGDSMVPCSQSELLKAKAKDKTTLVILEHSGHCGMADLDRSTYQSAVEKFLAQLPGA